MHPDQSAGDGGYDLARQVAAALGLSKNADSNR